MKEEWNPFKEKTEQVNSVLSTVMKLVPYITIIVVVLIVCMTYVSAYRSYLYRTNHSIPCEHVQELLKKQGIK